jgi:hypothetical protein
MLRLTLRVCAAVDAENGVGGLAVEDGKVCDCDCAALFILRSNLTHTVLNITRIGERLSPYVGLSCVAMAVSMLLY